MAIINATKQEMLKDIDEKIVFQRKILKESKPKSQSYYEATGALNSYIWMMSIVEMWQVITPSWGENV